MSNSAIPDLEVLQMFGDPTPWLWNSIFCSSKQQFTLTVRNKILSRGRGRQQSHDGAMYIFHFLQFKSDFSFFYFSFFLLLSSAFLPVYEHFGKVLYGWERDLWVRFDSWLVQIKGRTKLIFPHLSPKFSLILYPINSAINSMDR